MRECNKFVYVAQWEFLDLPKVILPKRAKTYDPYEDNGGSIYDSPFAERKRQMTY